MPSIDSGHLSVADRERLLAIARQSIRAGLATGAPGEPRVEILPASLQAPGACFVTLKLNGQLRGCVGSLMAHRPLAVDAAENAFAAALRDRRFLPLREAELGTVALSISVLSPPQPLPVTSEADLLAQLRPGVDGLVLHEGQLRSTFLPAVWETLPDAASFVAELKQKAGLPADYWSDTLHFERYQTESFAERGPA